MVSEILYFSLPDIFIQDGTLNYMGKSVELRLGDCKVKYFRDCPSSSPDLNPMENLWSIIKRRLCDTPSLTKLGTVIREAWASFPMETLHASAEPVPGRLAERLKHQENATKY